MTTTETGNVQGLLGDWHPYVTVIVNYLVDERERKSTLYRLVHFKKFYDSEKVTIAGLDRIAEIGYNQKDHSARNAAKCLGFRGYFNSVSKVSELDDLEYDLCIIPPNLNKKGVKAKLFMEVENQNG